MSQPQAGLDIVLHPEAVRAAMRKAVSECFKSRIVQVLRRVTPIANYTTHGIPLQTLHLHDGLSIPSMTAESNLSAKRERGEKTPH